MPPIPSPHAHPIPALLLGGLLVAACQETAGPADHLHPNAMMQRALVASITDLGTLPGGTTSDAVAINNAGQIVGSAETDVGQYRRHAFLWEHGTMRDLGLDEDDIASRVWLSEAGTILVTFEDAEGGEHTVVWQDGAMTDIGTLGGCCTSGHAISANGRVAGTSVTESDAYHGYVWQNGTMTDLGTLGGPGFDVALALNEREQVVGASQTESGEQHAFLWEHGAMLDLGALGGLQSSAQLINERGQIAGWWTSSPSLSTQHAFLWNGGELSDLGLGASSDPTDMNEPPRDCRRLRFLRGWSHGQVTTVFTGGPGAGRADGPRA